MSTTLTSQPGRVTRVNVMGSRWLNENRGGFTFSINSMPSDIDYFIVRPLDLGLELFFTQLLTAQSHDRNVSIDYVRTNPTGGGKYEGDVIAIASV